MMRILWLDPSIVCGFKDLGDHYVSGMIKLNSAQGTRSRRAQSMRYKTRILEDFLNAINDLVCALNCHWQFLF